MPKLTLVAAPTFSAKVGIPVAGGEPLEVKMTFRHRTRDDLEAWRGTLEGKSDVDACLDMVTGWEFEEELNADNVALLFQHRIGAPLVIFQTYMRELREAKRGN